MVPDDIYSTLQWLHDSGPATIHSACKETFQEITNQTLFLPVSTHTAVKNPFFSSSNFAISRAEAPDIFAQLISQELGCKSRAQVNVWKSKLGGASHFQLLQLRLRWGQCNYCFRANKNGTFLIRMWELTSFGLIPSTDTPLNIDTDIEKEIEK